MSESKKVLILFGPTASGKTAVIRKLFAEEKIAPAEIISSDSMQVYRGMDIGTAKPSLTEREKLIYHLIDIRNPDEQFNAGDFVRLAEEIVPDIAKRGYLPVVSGGTGFYLKNLISGLPESPPSDKKIRENLKNELLEKGIEVLFEELKKNDPISAIKIHKNDHYRLIRALEVIRLTGKPLSFFLQNKKNEKENSALFEFLVIGLKMNRNVLYERINERCSQMFQQGLPAEVKKLFEAGYTADDPGLKAIGYKEFFVPDRENRENEKNGRKKYRLLDDYADIEKITASNSRRYAKRQITFFSAIENAVWIDADDENTAAEKINPLLEKFLKAN